VHATRPLRGLRPYYGIAKIGAVINPINVVLTPEEVRDDVEDWVRAS
jgi:hypothetical protein